MVTIGSKLKKARESKRITLLELQELTKIQLRYLEAIEEDDFASLPGEYNTKAFLRQYARAVSLDPDQIISEYMGAPVREEDLSQYQQVTRGSRQQQHQNSSFLEHITKALPLILLIAMFCLIVGGIVYGYYRDRDKYSVLNPQSSYQVESTSDTNQEATSDTQSKEDSSEVINNKTSIDLDVAQGTTITGNVSAASNPLELSLESINGGRCWIGVTVDGVSLYNNTLEADGSEKINLPKDAKNIEISLGAAQYVKIELDEQKVDFTSGNAGLLQATISLVVSYD